MRKAIYEIEYVIALNIHESQTTNIFSAVIENEKYTLHKINTANAIWGTDDYEITYEPFPGNIIKFNKTVNNDTHELWRRVS